MAQSIPQGVQTQQYPQNQGNNSSSQNNPQQKKRWRELMKFQLQEARQRLAEWNENRKARKEGRKQSKSDRKSDKVQGDNFSNALTGSNERVSLGGFLRLGGLLLWILDVFLFAYGFRQKFNSYYYLHIAFAIAAYFSFPRKVRKDYLFPISGILAIFIILPTAQHYFDLFLARAVITSGNVFLDFLIYIWLTPVPYPFWFYYGLSFRRDSKDLSAKTFKVFQFVFVTLPIIILVWSLLQSEAVADTIDKNLAINTGNSVNLGTIANAGDRVKDVIIKTAKEGIKKITELPKQIALEKEKSLEYATGGYYQGQVEEKAVEELGLFIEEVKSSQLYFFDDENAIVWATLRARTLDKEKAMDVKLECIAGDENAKDKYTTGSIVPSESSAIKVYGYEQHDVGCELSNDKVKKLGPGIHPVKFKAAFDFKTQAYLKTYFMDSNVKRSLQREGIDIFKHYGITDTYPIAKFTNGPVKIGAEITNNLPIGISKNERILPRLGITVENQWNGKIDKIVSLRIYVPDGIKLSNCPLLQPESVDKDGAKYNLYTVDLKSSSLKEHSKNVDKYFSVNCIMSEIDSLIVLAGNSISTRYVLIETDYDYQMDKSFNIEIRKSRSTEEEEIDNTIKENEVENFPLALSNAEKRSNGLSLLVDVGNECVEGNKDKAKELIESTKYFEMNNLRALVDSAELCSEQFYIGIKDRIIDSSDYIMNALESAKAKLPSFDSSERSSRESDWKRVAVKADTIIYSAIKSLESIKGKGININDEDISKVKNVHERVVQAQKSE